MPLSVPVTRLGRRPHRPARQCRRRSPVPSSRRAPPPRLDRREGALVGVPAATWPGGTSSRDGRRRRCATAVTTKTKTAEYAAGVEAAFGCASSNSRVVRAASASRPNAIYAPKSSARWRCDGVMLAAIAAGAPGKGPPSVACGAMLLCGGRRWTVDLPSALRVAEGWAVYNGSRCPESPMCIRAVLGAKHPREPPRQGTRGERCGLLLHPCLWIVSSLVLRD